MMYELTTCCAYVRWLPIGQTLSLCSWNCFQHILLFLQPGILGERCHNHPSSGNSEQDAVTCIRPAAGVQTDQGCAICGLTEV